MAERGAGRGPQGGPPGLNKVHTAKNPTTGEERQFTQAQWKDPAFRKQLQAEGFERPEELEGESEDVGTQSDSQEGQD